MEDIRNVIDLICQLDRARPLGFLAGHIDLFLPSFRFFQGPVVRQFQHHIGHVFSESINEFLVGRLGILDGVMEQRSHERDRIMHSCFQQTVCDTEGMVDVRSRVLVLPALEAMPVSRKLSCLDQS